MYDGALYTLYNCPYTALSHIPIQKRGPGNPKSRKNKFHYKNCICAFDIETTNVPEIRQSIMYIWQFCTADMVCMGRSWDEFILLLQKINQHFTFSGAPAVYVIYVHNLAFEFAFASGILTQAGYQYEVFATRNRKVLTWRIPDLQIEFRCSAKLTNRSLKKLLKD